MRIEDIPSGFQTVLRNTNSPNWERITLSQYLRQREKQSKIEDWIK